MPPLEEHPRQRRRFRFRLRTLLIAIALLALLLVNFVQWVRLEEARARAESSAADAMRARQAAEAALLRAQVAAKRYSAQAAKDTVKPEAAPRKADSGQEQP
jgi:hypothetical protein